MKASTFLSFAMITVLSVLMLQSSVQAIYTGNSQKQELAEPTRLVVKFKSDVVLNLKQGPDDYVMSGRPGLDALNQRYRVKNQAPLLHAGAIRTPDNPLRNVHLIAPSPGADIEGMARDYGQLDIVEYACPDYPLELYDVPNDPLYSHQWALNNTGQECYTVLRGPAVYDDVLILEAGTPDADIDAEEVFINPPDHTSTVVVAIIDTGIDWDHPDLAPMVWQNPGEIPDNGLDDDHNGYIDDVVGWDFTGWDLSDPITMFEGKFEDNDPTDTYGHGTHCAGIVAAVINNGVGVCGVVPQARIMGLKTDPSSLSMSCGALAIVYAVDNGADVLSMSWGALHQIPIVEEALIYARSRGVVAVASNGNDGLERVNYPTGYAQTISVGASTKFDQVASFSTTGTNLCVCAPGQGILSLRADETDMYAGGYEPNVHIIDDHYYLASGTSMSGPYVAAQAAYLRSVSPGLKPEIVQEVIESTADDIVDPYGAGVTCIGWDMFSGYGRVNLSAALAAVPRAGAVITAPSNFDLLSGTIDIVGTADGDDFASYVLEYNTGDTSSGWINISSSSSPVTDGLLGTLNASGLEGVVTIRLRVDDYSETMVRVLVASGEHARIVSPANGDTVGGLVSVIGSAVCLDYLMSIISYGAGASPAEYVPIDTITAQKYETLLTQWTTDSVADGTYSLRLEVFSSSGLAASHTVVIDVRSPFSPPNGWSVNIGDTLNRTPNLADLDQDGIPEILIGTSSGIKVFSPDGTPKTGLTISFPTVGFTRVPIAVGRLDNDGFDDVVAVSDVGTVHVYPSQGEPLEFSAANPYSLGTSVLYNYREPAVYLKDVDADGIDEIHYYAVGNTGTRAYQMFDINDADACSLVVNYGVEHCLPVDLDGDGYDEVYGLSDGYLLQYDYCSGFIRSERLVVDHSDANVGNAFMSAVDIDGDNHEELIVFANAYSTLDSREIEYWLFAYDEGMVLKDGWPHNTGLSAYSIPTPPVFCDLDGDGIPEYAAALRGGVFAFRIDGTPFLENGSSTGLLAATSMPGMINNLLVTDIDGDNQPDLVCYAMRYFQEDCLIERIEAFDRWGNVIDGFPLLITTDGQSIGHTPVIGDLDGDGHVDLLTSTTVGTLNFINFPAAEYHPELDFCSSWRYNRQRNLSAPMLTSGVIYQCGDADGDGEVVPLDAVYLIEWFWRGGPPPVSLDAVDVDGSGNVNPLDASYFVMWMWRGGPGLQCP